MPSTYIPSREAALDRWLANFAEHIAAAPESYGLETADAVQISETVAAWHEAYVASIAPTTRTSIAVLAKKEAKRDALAVVRRFAAMIRANPSVSNSLRITIGLHVPTDARPAEGEFGGDVSGGSPIRAPETAPIVMISGMNWGVQKLRFRDSGPTTRRARPAGTVGLLLFRAITDAPLSRPTDVSFLALVTRPRAESHFTSEDGGKFATYFARWASPRGQLGPWSAPASMRIAA